MKVLMGLFCVTAMLLTALLPAQCMKPNSAGILPVATETAGGGGSYWQTDAIITDVGTPARAQNAVELWVWIHDAGVMRSVGRTVYLNSGQTFKITRVLDWIGGGTRGSVPYGSGEIYMINFWATYPVVASGRLYNTNTPDRADLVPGFGQGLPFLSYNMGMSPGEQQYYPVPMDPNVARVNLGISNVGWTSGTVYVSLFDDLGTPIATVNLRNEYTVREQEVIQFQVNHPSIADLTGYAPGYIRIDVGAAEVGGIYTYVSVVDNVREDGGEPTSDPYMLYGIQQW